MVSTGKRAEADELFKAAMTIDRFEHVSVLTEKIRRLF
jgi:hypothetical protein